MRGLGNQHSSQWYDADPVRANRLEDLNEDLADIRANGSDRANVRKSKGTQLHACDATTGWTESGVGIAPAVNSDKYLEGTGALKLGATGAGTATYTLAQAAVDFASATHLMLDFWLDYAAYGKITSITIKVGSDASNYKSIALTITDADYGDWNHRYSILISDMSDTGTPDMANLDYAAVDIVASAAIASGLILIDDIRFSDLAVDVGAFSANVGNTIVNVAEVTELVLADNDTNYVEVNASGTVSANQTGFTGTSAQIAEVVTLSGVITTITLKKTDIVGGNLGGGAGKLYRIDKLTSDKEFNITNKLLFKDKTNMACAKFALSKQSSGWFQLELSNGWSAGDDIIFDINHVDSVGGGNYRLQLEYWVVSDGGDTTPTTSPTATKNETVAAASAIETMKKTKTTTLKIDASDLSAVGDIIICKFSRLATDAADTATGHMYVNNMVAYQE